MLTKNEFMEGIHILQDNYNRKLTGTQLKLFYEHLKEMNKEKFIANINSIIGTSSFMPTISQILSEPRSQYSNHEQREYTEEELNKLYAN